MKKYTDTSEFDFSPLSRGDFRAGLPNANYAGWIMGIYGQTAGMENTC